MFWEYLTKKERKDGHQSQFSLTFLKYITSSDHLWKVCIGASYGTALCQVEDSLQQNGNYEMSTSKKKKGILHRRITQFISDVEIIPLILLQTKKAT